jgi:hypothetical protein
MNTSLIAICRNHQLKLKLDLARYRQLLSVFCYIKTAIVNTRSYEAGLNLALDLLNFADDHKSLIGVKDYEVQARWFYELILDMYDRMDRWEEYMALWQQIRMNTSFSYLSPAGEPKKTGFRRMDKWHREQWLCEQANVLQKDGENVRVHWLACTWDRKAIIERKLARKRAGKSADHLKHHPPEELSEKDIRERLDFVILMAKQDYAWRQRR